MPHEVSREQNTVLQNLRLVITPWTVLVGVIYPILAYVAFMYLCMHLWQESIFPPRARFFFAMSLPLSAIPIALRASDSVKARLDAAGFTQRRTRARELDLLLNLAVCGAAVYWLLHWDLEHDFHSAWLYVHLLVSSLSYSGILFLVTLGPLIWFTVRDG